MHVTHMWFICERENVIIHHTWSKASELVPGSLHPHSISKQIFAILTEVKFANTAQIV